MREPSAKGNVTQQQTIERQVKMGVWPGFQLPDLRGALNGVVPDLPEESRLEAVYFDTADLRLLRRGVTVRFRRGEAPEEVWTATLPERAVLGLERREVSVAGGPASVPAFIQDLVRGWALGAPLVPVARLRTLRYRTTLTRSDGKALAVVDDDEVSIIQRSRVAARFRELELELVDGASAKLLARLTERMRVAGAQPVDQVPKLVRALGPAALAPWDLEAPGLEAEPTAADVIRAALIASAASVVEHLAAVVLDEDLEGVHQTRVGIRRLRSDLKTAGPLLETKTVKPLRRELSWMTGRLGEVRDLDVLLVRLRSDIEALAPADRSGAEAVLAGATEDRAAAYEQLRVDLRTERCAALLEDAARIAANPPLKSRTASKPAADVLPGLIRGPLRDLRQERRKQGSRPDDAGLHRLRTEVKRVRYATELAAPVAGKKARRAAKGLARIQEVLGQHNDACVAQERLRSLGERADTAGAWAAGVLGGLQMARGARCREQLPSVWKKAAGAKRWRWIG